MIGLFALALATTLGQIACLSVIAPFLTDLEHSLQGLGAGRSSIAPGWRWRQIRRGWAQRRAVPALSWLGLCAVFLAMTGIPYASARSLFGFLSEPLACGVLLILSCLPAWMQALQKPPTRLIALRLRSSVGQLGRDLLFLVPLLALTGTLITIGLPGAGTLIGLLQQRLLQPAPTLIGGLVFVAAALLLVLNRRFLSDSWHEELIASAEGRHRALLRYSHDLSACCWYLLIADLVWPDSIAAGTRPLGTLVVLWCVAAPAKLALVVALAAGWRACRPLPASRLALVLSGAAILLVLAGRLAA
ncbi:hypothetical protein HW511_00995 [Asaia siamensis]|uniref:Uncharacterized protein n=1 Tax=Asaia siamensis TaxID=110479 RepID=A0ABQ1M926_9PROT|nr:hypothetical protein [Asaia siamensis]GBR05998.1 hypothetical protein AA0323_1233 [Asaia siamensis NRIC 0323]GGC35397.1 hypothetical protein GCM10007207_21200 [Asaia siamensis]